MSTTTTTPAAPALTEFQTIEADIQAFVTKVITEAEVLIEDAVTALGNVAALAPTIAADVTSAANFIEGIPGVGTNPAVMAAVAAVNVANTGLQAFAATYEQATAAGGSVTLTQATQAVVAGYQAVKSAQSAAAALTGTGIAATPAGAAAVAATAPVVAATQAAS